MPLYKSSTHSPITDQAACKSQASTSSPEHFLGLFTWSLKLLWISWIPKLSLWVVLKLQMKKKNTNKQQPQNTKHHIQSCYIIQQTKGCLLEALVVWYLQTAAVSPFASFPPHPDILVGHNYEKQSIVPGYLAEINSNWIFSMT